MWHFTKLILFVALEIKFVALVKYGFIFKLKKKTSQLNLNFLNNNKSY